MPDVDLSLVPMNALLDEVFARCEHGEVALLQVGEQWPDTTTLRVRWKGNSHTAAGLAANASWRILAAYDEASKPLDEEGFED